MYNSLLVPLDGSPFAEQALPLATAIARASGAAVHLVSVHLPIYSTVAELGPGMVQQERTWDDDIRAEEREYLETTGKRLAEECGLRVESAVLEDPVVEALGRHAAAVGAELIVMTTHGRTGWRREWLGSVADGLVRRAITPVLALRSSGGALEASRGTLFRHVFIPLDGSAEAERILEPAVALGVLAGASYTLVMVVVPATHHGRPHAPTELLEERVARATKYLNGIAERLRGRGCDVRTEVRVHAQPIVELLDRLAASGADLVALTTHGRGASRLLVGSVADKLIRGTTMPLLFSRATARE